MASDGHNKAMAFIYRDIIFLENVHFEVDDLISYIIHDFGEGSVEEGVKALEAGVDMYGTQVWKDALDKVRKEL